jgi:hypothetical protein
MSVGKGIVLWFVAASISPSLRLTTLTRGGEGWRVRKKSIVVDIFGRISAAFVYWERVT